MLGEVAAKELAKPMESKLSKLADSMDLDTDMQDLDQSVVKDDIDDLLDDLLDAEAEQAIIDDAKLFDLYSGLTNEEKAIVKAETGWSDEIVNALRSMEEYEIYKNAGLQEVKIGEKTCLIRTDIDWDAKDELGRTNKERVQEGLAPKGNDGKPIELHHIGQHPDSPFAELTNQEHHSGGNDAILHNKTKLSEIDRQAFSKEKTQYWNERIREGGID